MNLQERFKKASFDRDNDNVQEAIIEYAQIREKALSEGLKELAIDCLHMTGISYSHIEDYKQAEEFFQKAQSEFKQVGNKMKVGAVLRDRGSIAAASGNLNQAEELMQQSIHILKLTEFPGHLGISKVKMGMINLKRGKADEAEQEILEGIKDIEQSKDKWFESTAYFNLAEVQKELGKKSEVKQSLNKALEILNQIARPNEHSRRRQKITQLLQELNHDLTNK